MDFDFISDEQLSYKTDSGEKVEINSANLIKKMTLLFQDTENQSALKRVDMNYDESKGQWVTQAFEVNTNNLHRFGFEITLENAQTKCQYTPSTLQDEFTQGESGKLQEIFIY